MDANFSGGFNSNGFDDKCVKSYGLLFFFSNTRAKAELGEKVRTA